MTNSPKTEGKALLNNAHNHMPLGVADSYRYWGEQDTVFLKSMKGGTDIDE